MWKNFRRQRFTKRLERLRAQGGLAALAEVLRLLDRRRGFEFDRCQSVLEYGWEHAAQGVWNVCTAAHWFFGGAGHAGPWTAAGGKAAMAAYLEITEADLDLYWNDSAKKGGTPWLGGFGTMNWQTKAHDVAARLREKHFPAK